MTNAKILIVDDEPAIGKLLLYQLTSSNYAVTYVSDGLSALERIERERPDLVLLDVMMPTMSGWEVCKQIRSCSDIPVIILTAKNSDGDIVTGLEAGADDYVAKPFSLLQLQARIEAVLRRSRSGSRPRLLAHTAPVPLEAAQSPTEPAPTATPANATSATTTPVEAPPLLPTEALKRLGPRLRDARIARDITLFQAARACSTRWEFLQAIEQENYAYVPRPQLRAAIQRYGQYLDVPVPQAPQPPQPAKQGHVLQYATIITLVLLMLAVGFYML